MNGRKTSHGLGREALREYKGERNPYQMPTAALQATLKLTLPTWGENVKQHHQLQNVERHHQL